MRAMPDRPFGMARIGAAQHGNRVVFGSQRGVVLDLDSRHSQFTIAMSNPAPRGSVLFTIGASVFPATIGAAGGVRS